MCEARWKFAKNKTPNGGFEIWDLRRIKHGTMEPLIYSSQNLKGGFIYITVVVLSNHSVIFDRTVLETISGSYRTISTVFRRIWNVLERFGRTLLPTVPARLNGNSTKWYFWNKNLFVETEQNGKLKMVIENGYFFLKMVLSRRSGVSHTLRFKMVKFNNWVFKLRNIL